MRTGGLGRALLWAGISYALATLVTLINNYLARTDIPPWQGSVISTGVGLLGAFVGVLIERAKSDAPQKLPPSQPGQPQRQPRRGGVSWVAAILTILLLCGGGGLVLAYGVQWVGGKAFTFIDEQSKPDWQKKAEETGEQRLAAPATSRAGKLTVTVTSVEVTKRATLITVTAANSGPESMVMSACQLTVPGSNTLQRDPPAGDWGRGEVPAGGELTGLIVLDGVIGPQVSKVKLAFTNIFSMDFAAPKNITVEITLKTTSS